MKSPPANKEDIRDLGSVPGSEKILWKRAWQPTPVFLPGESPGSSATRTGTWWAIVERDTKSQT